MNSNLLSHVFVQHVTKLRKIWKGYLGIRAVCVSTDFEKKNTDVLWGSYIKLYYISLTLILSIDHSFNCSRGTSIFHQTTQIR